MKQARLLFVIVFLLATCRVQAKTKGEMSLVQVASDDSPAILQMAYWGQNGSDPNSFNVDGTGFLVGRDGYFITAAHVLERYKASTGQLTAVIHQRDGSGSGLWFEVIEKDREHDLALCKLLGFKPTNEPSGGPRPKLTFRPVTSLAVSAEPAKAGELIAMIGFPLGSFVSPIVQIGNIAATDAMLESVPNFPAGKHELLIVSAAGNHGNSGCPVISLETGKTLGMIIQYVPAPLLSMRDSQGEREVPQQSGLMVAVPAKWILQLLDRHGISNIPLAPGEHLVM